MTGTPIIEWLNTLRDCQRKRNGASMTKRKKKIVTWEYCWPSECSDFWGWLSHSWRMGTHPIINRPNAAGRMEFGWRLFGLSRTVEFEFEP